jgi:transposase
MPRQSPFCINLSADAKEMLESAARRYTSSYRDVLRAKIILYAAQGLRNDEIALRLDAPRPVVCKWRKRFFERGLAGLEDLPRRGRPGALSRRSRRRRKGPRL